MIQKIRKINRGIVLLFILVIIAVVVCIVNTSRYSSRKQAAEDKATAFVAELAALYEWPADMPDVDADMFDRKEKLYSSYLDAGINKVKPHIFDSPMLREELKDDAGFWFKSYLFDKVKPKQVTFAPNVTKVKLRKERATVQALVSAKIVTSEGKIKNRSFQCEISLEYYKGDWVVVRFLRLE